MLELADLVYCLGRRDFDGKGSGSDLSLDGGESSDEGCELRVGRGGRKLMVAVSDLRSWRFHVQRVKGKGLES